MSSFRRSVFVVLFGVVMAMGTSSAAHAKDWCISEFGSNLWVLKGFSVPSKGKCKSVIGYLQIGGGGDPNAANGSACTDSGQTHVTVQLTTQFPPPASEGIMDVLKFPLPSLTGGDLHEAEMYPVPSDRGSYIGIYTLAPCPNPVPPAP